jgi:hypothetical protein
MKIYLFILPLFVVSSGLSAGELPDRKYSLIKAESYVQSKNYYLLTLLQQLPEVNKLICNDDELSKIAITKKDNLKSKLKSCSDSVICYLESVKFSSSEIQNIGARLVLTVIKDDIAIRPSTHVVDVVFVHHFLR